MILNQVEFIQQYEQWKATDHHGIFTGTPIDSVARLQKGDFVAIVGCAKGGKSTFIHWYLAQLTMVADWHIALVDFESETGEIFKQISAITNPHHTATHIHPITNVNTMDEVIYDVEQAKKLYDIDCLVIDPYSNLMGREVNTYTINADLAALQALGKKLDIAVILLCHPTKSTGRGEDKLSLYSVLGSAAFAQKVDLGLTLSSDYNTKTTTITAEMVRHRQRGEMGEKVEIIYDPETCNYTMSDLDAMFSTDQSEKPIANIAVEQKIDFSALQALEVNYYNRATSDNENNYKKVKLIEGLTTTEPEIVEHINYLRQHVGEMSKEEKQTYKRTHFPVLAPSATFLPDAPDRKAESIQEYTNVIVIDIDMKDNEGVSLDELQKTVHTIPYVFYSAVSVSGKGLLALILLESVDSPEKFNEYFNALKTYFNGKGIVIDKSCKDPTRLRYITYDPNPYTNENALVWCYRTPRYVPMKTRHNNTPSDPYIPKKRFVSTSTLTDTQKMEYILSDVKNNDIVINPTHDDTLTMSAALANTFGQDGWSYFTALNTPKHGEDAADPKYETLYNQDVSSPSRETTFGSLVDLYKKAKKIEKVDWDKST